MESVGVSKEYLAILNVVECVDVSKVFASCVRKKLQ